MGPLDTEQHEQQEQQVAIRERLQVRALRGLLPLLALEVAPNLRRPPALPQTASAVAFPPARHVRNALLKH